MWIKCDANMKHKYIINEIFFVIKMNLIAFNKIDFACRRTDRNCPSATSNVCDVDHKYLEIGDHIITLTRN